MTKEKSFKTQVNVIERFVFLTDEKQAIALVLGKPISLECKARAHLSRAKAPDLARQY